MKNYINKIVVFLLLFVVISCQKEDDSLIEESLLTENLSTEEETEILEKSNTDVFTVCSYGGIPNGYRVLYYTNSNNCPNLNLFLGLYNAAVVVKINAGSTPKIISAGAGCNDNYCIWIVGTNFENNAYVDIRTTTGSSIIGTYRGANRTLTTNAQGQQVITLRLASAYERSQFASRGLRIWVVNPDARKWADGRTVRRPNTGPGPIDPPCNPICP